CAIIDAEVERRPPDAVVAAATTCASASVGAAEPEVATTVAATTAFARLVASAAAFFTTAAAACAAATTALVGPRGAAVTRRADEIAHLEVLADVQLRHFVQVGIDRVDPDWQAGVLRRVAQNDMDALVALATTAIDANDGTGGRRINWSAERRGHVDAPVAARTVALVGVVDGVLLAIDGAAFHAVGKARVESGLKQSARDRCVDRAGRLAPDGAERRVIELLAG